MVQLIGPHSFLDLQVVAMPPAIEDGIGFSQALGRFDAVIDTLGDEARLNRVEDSGGGVERVFGEVGLGSILKRENRCERCVLNMLKGNELF